MKLKKRIKVAVKVLLNIKLPTEVNIGPFIDRDFTNEEAEIISDVSDYTMTGSSRLVTLIRAINYLSKNKISGDIVECGVWKGGSIMAAIKALQLSNDLRDIYLYDTFEGMSEPIDIDTNEKGMNAKDIIENDLHQKCISSLGEVKFNINSLDYPKERVNYVVGKVEDTIPKNIPDKIALLRLDTDWYESTTHELNHLFPKLVKGGILIIDDYGHWNGCRMAVDEYFEQLGESYFFNRIDYTCRLIIKK